MKIQQLQIASGAQPSLVELEKISPHLLMVYADVSFFESDSVLHHLAERFPLSVVCGCSTAGEIGNNQVHDKSCWITAIHFEHSQCHCVSTPLANMDDSFNAGERLGKAINHDGLSAIFLLGTGVDINGSALIKGLEKSIPKGVSISGGLAADAGAFKETWTLGPEGPTNNHILAVGFYGSRLNFSYGTFAGWEPFGPARKVTRSDGNILYELDNKPALDIYKQYLGDYAKDLPAAGLLFPFEMLDDQHQKAGIFRTILGINEEDGSIVLAGDIDAGGYLKLMHASSEKLITGAEAAAALALKSKHSPASTSLAILVSCIGRKLVMGDRVDEEVEAVADTLGQTATITGFYSNGEIAGTEFMGECKLHNQTMTITWITEQ